MSLLIKHKSNISDKIFHLYYHHRIKSGVEHFLVRTQNVCSPTCQQTRILKIRIATANNNTYTANNTANNINEANENNSDAESYVSTESEASKAKRDRWNTQQTGALVNMWKDHYKELKSSKQQHSIWILIKNKTDAVGKPKTLNQIKTKIRNLKDAYKACKDNNKKTGRSPTFCPYFQDFEISLEQGMLLIFLMQEKQVLQIKKMSDRQQKMKVNVI